MTNLESILKSWDITLQKKVRLVKAMVFPVVMYGCESWDYKERWALKNWYFWTVMLEKTLRVPWTARGSKPVHPKGNQSWISVGRTDAEAETPIFWPRDVKNWLIWKDPDAGKDWGREKGMTEDEMVAWHHQLNGHAAAAVAAKLLHSCPTLCDPIDGSLPGSSVHGTIQARTLEWVATAFSQWTWVWVNSGSWWWIERPGVPQPVGLQSRTRLSNWTELNMLKQLLVIQAHKMVNRNPDCKRTYSKRWAIFFNRLQFTSTIILDLLLTKCLATMPFSQGISGNSFHARYKTNWVSKFSLMFLVSDG